MALKSSKPWVRLYVDLVDNEKAQRLDPLTFKTWINILLVASETDGYLPEPDALAWRIRFAPVTQDGVTGDIQTVIRTLVNVRLIDDTGRRLRIHNWSDRQFKSDTSAERTRRYRQRQRDGDVTSHVTPPESESDTDTESLTSFETRARGQSEFQLSADEKKPKRISVEKLFADWWQEYPHKIGKGAAKAAYAKAIQRASPDDLTAGVKRYIEAKPRDRSYCNPATWLNQDRWLDQPATVDRAPASGWRDEQQQREDDFDQWVKRGGS